MTGVVLAVTGGGLLCGHTEAFSNVPFGKEEICRCLAFEPMMGIVSLAEGRAPYSGYSVTFALKL